MARKPKSKKPGTAKKFHLKFTGHGDFLGSRKDDSNYYRRLIAEKKITYLHYLMENIDRLAVVSSFITPEIKPGLIDRFLVLAHHFGKTPFLVLTKADLVDKEAGEYYSSIYAPHYPTYVVSTTEVARVNYEKEYAEIIGYFKNHRTAIVGHSGVGKTSLLNVIDPEFNGMVSEVSTFTKRGRHTTTRIRRYDFSSVVGGGTVYDMPGLKELDFIDLTPEKLRGSYPEFVKVAEGCEYRDCTHTHEPVCAVRSMVEEVDEDDLLTAKIHPVRYQNYLNILESLALK